MVAKSLNIGSEDIAILRMAFALSVGQYLLMDATLLMKMVMEWKIMTRKWFIASSIRKWKLSYLSSQ